MALNSDLSQFNAGLWWVRGCRVKLCTPTHPLILFVIVSPYGIYHQNSSSANIFSAKAFSPISTTWRVWSHHQLLVPTSISGWSSDTNINKCAHSICSLMLITSTASAVCRRIGRRVVVLRLRNGCSRFPVAFDIFSPGHHWQPPPHEALANWRRWEKNLGN